MKIFLIYLLNYSCFFYLQATVAEEIITQVLKSCITIITPVIAYFVYIYVYTHREEIIKKLGIDIHQYQSFTDETKEIIKQIHNTTFSLKEKKEQNNSKKHENTSSGWYRIFNFIIDILYNIWNIFINIFNVFISIFMNIIKQIIIGVLISIIVYYIAGYIMHYFDNFTTTDLQQLFSNENIKMFFSKIWTKK